MRSIHEPGTTSGRQSSIAGRSIMLGALALAIVLSLAATLVVGQPVAEAAPAEQNNGLSAAKFTLAIEGSTTATFSELQGINSEIGAEEYHMASDRGVTYSKLPDKPRPPTITLKRGLTSSMELWTWHENARNGKVATSRKSVTLTMLSADGKPVAKYFLENAWPSRIEVGGVKSGASDAIFETVTLVCESMQRVAP